MEQHTITFIGNFLEAGKTESGPQNCYTKELIYEYLFSKRCQHAHCCPFNPIKFFDIMKATEKRLMQHFCLNST